MAPGTPKQAAHRVPTSVWKFPLLLVIHSSDDRVYTNSWAVFTGCIHWLPSWNAHSFHTHTREIWGLLLRKKIQDYAHSRALAVGHIDSHSACPMAKPIWNAQADITAVIRGVAVVANTDTYEKANCSPIVADETKETLTQASNLDHRTSSLVAQVLESSCC